jgi:hypothetical protein
VVVDEMVDVHDNVLKPQMIKWFDRIVANWANRPGFAARKYLTSDSFSINIFPTGSEEVKNIWWYNVLGTRPHPIRPKDAPMLVFPWGGPGSYMSKTGPGGKWYGGPGTVNNATLRFSMGVQHPGTAPRNWTKLAAEEFKPIYSRTVENAWRRALRRIS